MGLIFHKLNVCRYFLICAWIEVAVQMNTQGYVSLSNGHHSSHSYFFYQQPEFPRDCEEVRNQCSSQNNSGVYLIKPDDSFEPFEVYCNNEESSTGGGWTIILRRLDGSLLFNRSWKEYQNGFGFLRGEFWLGNEKIAYLTNQKQYRLRLDVVMADGSSFNLTWNKFRLSDEWSDYTLFSLGYYNGPADLFVSCPRNMEFGRCTCQGTCDQPDVRNRCNNNCVQGEGCFCPDGFLFNGDDCVPEDSCGCFVQGRGVIANGDTYVNMDCSSRCTCNNDVLTCQNYRCDQHASCEVKNSVRMCYCDDHFQGDGQTCTSTRRDCLDLYNAGSRNNGIYNIYPSGWPGSSFPVYCDMTTEGKGWTIFQRRKNGRTSFYRSWNSYKVGFGNKNDEFWLGNDQLHTITNQRNYQLRVDLRDKHGASYYALYNLFRIGNEADNYRLVALGSFSGTTDYDSMNSRRNQPFSTYDNDNEVSEYDCAEQHQGGWWYGYNDGHFSGSDCVGCRYFQVGSSCFLCTAANLNGDYNDETRAVNIFWGDLAGDDNDCYLKFTEMKIRPV